MLWVAKKKAFCLLNFCAANETSKKSKGFFVFLHTLQLANTWGKEVLKFIWQYRLLLILSSTDGCQSWDVFRWTVALVFTLLVLSIANYKRRLLHHVCNTESPVTWRALRTLSQMTCRDKWFINKSRVVSHTFVLVKTGYNPRPVSWRSHQFTHQKQICPIWKTLRLNTQAANFHIANKATIIYSLLCLNVCRWKKRIVDMTNQIVGTWIKSHNKNCNTIWSSSKYFSSNVFILLL